MHAMEGTEEKFSQGQTSRTSILSGQKIGQLSKISSTLDLASEKNGLTCSLMIHGVYGHSILLHSY